MEGFFKQKIKQNNTAIIIRKIEGRINVFCAAFFAKTILNQLPVYAYAYNDYKNCNLINPNNLVCFGE